MGWQENRRRKRWWYLRYKWLAEDIERAIAGGGNLHDILLCVHRYTERGRHYGSGFRSRSAQASIELLALDMQLRNKHVFVDTVSPATTTAPMVDGALTEPVLRAAIERLRSREPEPFRLVQWPGDAVAMPVEVKPAPAIDDGLQEEL